MQRLRLDLRFRCECSASQGAPSTRHQKSSMVCCRIEEFVIRPYNSIEDLFSQTQAPKTAGIGTSFDSKCLIPRQPLVAPWEGSGRFRPTCRSELNQVSSYRRISHDLARVARSCRQCK